MKKSAKAYAKINLFLDVSGKREDGYHDILSIMQQVSLFEDVTVEFNRTDERENYISLTCSNDSVPTDSRNIAYKCANAFLSACGMRGTDVKIHIDKKIPQAGGLAGGSSDGAAVLKLLNELTGVNMDEDKLCEIGAKVGADIPFCIAGKTCVCRGIGDVLEKIDVKAVNYHAIISSAGEGVSTPHAYGLIDELMQNTVFSSDELFSDVLNSVKSGHIPSQNYNIFEKIVLPIRPEAARIKEILLSGEVGADFAMMSGSGPSIFALFCDEKRRDMACLKLKDENICAYPCEVII